MKGQGLPPLTAGYASADITPPTPGLTLSGFAARCNQPSTGVHDPLSVRALALEQGDRAILLLSFDLLAIGEPLAAEMEAGLDAALGSRFPRSARVLSCTHTHSAPASIRLIGCGIEDPGYWELLARRASETAAAAAGSMREARVRWGAKDVPGRNFNRRILLKDGRVVMAPHALDLVRKNGPGWDSFLFLRFDDASSGAPIAAVLNWAAHPATVCTSLVSGDYPAALCSALEDREGIPFMFLQGACGDLSATFGAMSFQDTAGVVGGVLDRLSPLPWKEAKGARIALASGAVPLAYGMQAPRSELEQMAGTMQEIARGRPGDPPAVRILENILNVPPGGAADPAMLRYIASILAEWARQTAAAAGRATAPDLAVKVLSLGPMILAFVAAEVFVETAYTVRGLFARTACAVVGYCAPLVGYLPTDEALQEGGYEAEYAYRFYGHPAAYAAGSEQKLVAVVRALATRLGVP